MIKEKDAGVKYSFADDQAFSKNSRTIRRGFAVASCFTCVSDLTFPEVVERHRGARNKHKHALLENIADPN